MKRQGVEEDLEGVDETVPDHALAPDPDRALEVEDPGLDLIQEDVPNPNPDLILEIVPNLNQDRREMEHETDLDLDLDQRTTTETGMEIDLLQRTRMAHALDPDPVPDPDPEATEDGVYNGLTKQRRQHHVLSNGIYNKMNLFIYLGSIFQIVFCIVFFF